MLVDTHCHLDLYPDPSSVARITNERPVHTIAVTNAPSVFSFTAQLAKTHCHIRPALGLHPELVATHGHEVHAFLTSLAQTRYVGEIGLDYTSNDETLRRKQRTVFQTILAACADAKDKVLTIHSRRAAADVIDTIGKDFPAVVILHWFSGSQKDLRRGLDFGFRFSVNPAMTLSESARKLIALLPPERVLTETDGPFVKCDNSPAEPRDVVRVVSYLASLWNRTEEAVERQIFDNFEAAVGIL